MRCARNCKKHNSRRVPSCPWRASIRARLKIGSLVLPWRGSVIAKTGTLLRTDGGASSLVGQMRTANGEVLLFVIMNQRGSVSRFRENQDYLVMLVQNTRGGPKAFDYKPLMLTMQLSHTESTVAAGEEYEPPSNRTDPNHPQITQIQIKCTDCLICVICGWFPTNNCAPRSEDRRGALPSNHSAACGTAAVADDSR